MSIKEVVQLLGDDDWDALADIFSQSDFDNLLKLVHGTSAEKAKAASWLVSLAISFSRGPQALMLAAHNLLEESKMKPIVKTSTTTTA